MLTIAEQGVKGFEVTAWAAVVAPAATPDVVVARLNAAMQRASHDPLVVEALKSGGVTNAVGTPQQFALFLQSELKTWARAATNSSVQIDNRALAPPGCQVNYQIIKMHEHREKTSTPFNGNPKVHFFRQSSANQVLGIVCIGIILAQLDLFIVNVGLPDIAHELHNDNLEDLSWILNGYAIAYAALLIFFGRLAERYRRDRSFLLGVAIFTVASAACAAANSVQMLVVFRIAQAAGAALLTPTSLGLLLASFPPEKRGNAVRTWSAIGGFAAALGPLLGGVLVMASWRWIFLVNVPIGLAALWIGWHKLPAVPGYKAQSPNPWAAILITAGIAALTFAIVKAGDWGWQSPRILLTFAVAVICLALFTRHCMKSENPFIDPKLFSVRQFTGASIATVLFSSVFGATLFSIVLWEQSIWAWSAMETGATIAPGPFLVPVVSLIFSRQLIQRFGPAAVVSAGVIVYAAGLVCWALLLGQAPHFAAAVCGMALIGVGSGLLFPTLMGVGMASLPASSFATGSGVINMIRQFGIAIGVAVFVAVLAAHSSLTAREEAFHRAWWIMAAVISLTLVPTWTLIRRERQ